jgi:hypothetical protein
MSKTKDGTSFNLLERPEDLATALDSHKTTAAFPVLSVPTEPGDPGDFMGIISRAR